MTTLILAFALSAPPEPPKPAPVPLDDATRAKLKEVAFQAAREGDTATLKEYFAAGFPADQTNARADTPRRSQTSWCRKRSRIRSDPS